MDTQTIVNVLIVLGVAGAISFSVQLVWHLLPRAVKKPLCFWIWATLAGGKTPFYQARQLHRFQTYTEPGGLLRRWLWNKAVDYLISIGELTHTPSLKEKF